MSAANTHQSPLLTEEQRTMLGAVRRANILPTAKWKAYVPLADLDLVTIENYPASRARGMRDIKLTARGAQLAAELNLWTPAKRGQLVCCVEQDDPKKVARILKIRARVARNKARDEQRQAKLLAAHAAFERGVRRRLDREIEDLDDEIKNTATHMWMGIAELASELHPELSDSDRAVIVHGVARQVLAIAAQDSLTTWRAGVDERAAIGGMIEHASNAKGGRQ